VSTAANRRDRTARRRARAGAATEDQRAAAELPPRPPLPRLTMATGFVLSPTKFFDACRASTGDYFTLRPVPGRTLVVTADPEAVRQVFTADPAKLLAGEANVILAPMLGPRSVLLLDEPEHMRQRRLLLPPFHGERMRRWKRTMAEAAQWHVAGWPRGRRFPVLASMQAITLEVIMRVVFGVEEQRRRERLAGPLRRQLDLLGNRLAVLGLMLTSDGAGRGRGPLWARIYAARREADALIYEQIALRRSAHGHRRGHADDVLSMLLDARDDDGGSLTDDELRDELMTLLVAGHETTATALAWTLERITREPDVLERLQDDPGDERYLDAVIKETLRLRPVVPAVARKLTEPMRFGAWSLPAGVHIAPSIYLLHRREDLYPEPLRFRPERFLEHPPGSYEWIPFGGGVRRCLGASFALAEMRVVLQEILRSVRLRPAPEGDAGEAVLRRAVTFAPARGGRIAVQ
jgi:cytochrome P450